MAKCAIKEIIENPASYAVLELDHSVFCHAVRDQQNVGQEVASILEAFCTGEDKERLVAGVLLGDLYRAQVVPLTQEVSPD